MNILSIFCYNYKYYTLNSKQFYTHRELKKIIANRIKNTQDQNKFLEGIKTIQFEKIEIVGTLASVRFFSP